MFARVVARKRNTYQLQTRRGILSRWYTIRDLAPVPLALARTIDIPDNRREISLRQAAVQSINANLIRVACKCKGLCDTGRCSYKRAGKKCSIYYHQGSYDCRRVVEGIVFSEYTLIPRDAKGK